MEEQKERHVTLLADLRRLIYHKDLLPKEARELTKEMIELVEQEAQAAVQVENLGAVVEQLKLEVPFTGKAKPNV